MPRAGLPPEKPRAARSLATLRRSSPASSPTQMLAVAAGAIAFRLVSALVADFVSRLIPRTTADAAETTFGIAPMIPQFAGRWIGYGHATPSVILAWVAFAVAMVMLLRLA